MLIKNLTIIGGSLRSAKTALHVAFQLVVFAAAAAAAAVVHLDDGCSIDGAAFPQVSRAGRAKI